MVRHMRPYSWVLFDADETLFRFDSFRGLQLMFSRFEVAFTEQDYRDYQAVNKPLWVRYQDNAITAAQLKDQRFQAWSAKLKVSTSELNASFLVAMAEISSPLEGAENLLRSLKGVSRLGVITNGFSDHQQARLERTGFREHFDLLVVSEVVGFAKPHPRIFEHALGMMGRPAPETVLMVGDNPHSDIRGGLDAGLDTCWLNVEGLPAPQGITPKYQVGSLLELERLLAG